MSVLGNHRATEGVVHANRAHVDVATDALAAGGEARNEAAGRNGEGAVAVAHEQVVVLERNRPARSEADFEAGSHSATPTGLAGGVDHEARGSERAGVLVVGDRRAALDVPE